MSALKGFLIATLLLATSVAEAQSLAPKVDEEIAALKKRIEALEADQERSLATVSPENEELTKLRMEMQLPRAIGPRFTGLPPGVSQAYEGQRPELFGGFGEIHFDSADDGARETNVTRLVPYLGYRFSKGLVFNSGLAFESGGTGAGAAGSARVQFAYLDFLFAGDSGVRAGNVIVPFGLVSYRFEPNLFPMVHRPRPEETIIPSTWNENGILGFGKIGSFRVTGGLVNGLKAANFRSDSWIREGRQFGSAADARSPGWVLRVEHLGEDDESAGASFYVGDAAQSTSALNRAQVTLASLHGEWRARRFAAKALYVEGSLSDTDRIFALTAEAVASRVRGAYVILSYDLLPGVGPFAATITERTPAPGRRELPIFVAWEHDDLEYHATEGRTPVGGLKTNSYTVGFNYHPHPQVVLKADFAHRATEDAGTDRIIETGIGFVF